MNEYRLSQDKHFEIAKSEKSAYSSVFNQIASEFGVYSANGNGFDIGQNYIKHDQFSGSILPNENATTTEPLHLIDMVAAALSYFSVPSTENSINIKSLKGRLVADQGFDSSDKFFENSGRVMQSILMNPSVDFYSTLSSAIKQMILFGSTALMVDCKNPIAPSIDVIDFREIFIFRDDNGLLKKIWREFTPVEIETKGRNKLNKPVCHTQMFEWNGEIERENFNPMSGDLPIIYRLFNEHEELIDQAELPYWSIIFGSMFPEPGYSYCSGLGIKMLPHVIRLNAFKRFLFNAGHSQIHPPMQVLSERLIIDLKKKPEELRCTSGYGERYRSRFRDAFGFQFQPGQMIPVKSQEPVILPIQQSISLEPFQQFYQEDMIAVRAISMIDILMISDLSGNASIQEVEERVNRKIQVLSPMVSSVQNIIDGIVKNIFYSISANKKAKDFLRFGEVSGSLANLSISYETHFTKLSSFKKSNSIIALVNKLTAIAQLDPTILANFNLDLISREMAKLDGLGFVLNDEDQKQEALQKIQQMQKGMANG